MCYTDKGDGYNEPTDVSTVHKSTFVLEVDHNENEQSATSVHAGKPYAVIDSLPIMFDDDHMTPCTDELRKSNIEASQISCPVNDTPDLTFTCRMNCCTELSDTCSDTGASQNANTDLTCNLQNDSITLCDSYCGTHSDLVSQSQGLQLTNTQKVKIFAMELDRMKVRVSAHSSQDSFDSLNDMSAVFM